MITRGKSRWRLKLPTKLFRSDEPVCAERNDQNQGWCTRDAVTEEYQSRLLTLFLYSLVAVILSGCDLDRFQPGQLRTLERNFDGAPATLDPQRAVDIGATDLARDLFEGLVTTNPAGDLRSGTAILHAVSADGLSYEFIIRSNAKWSNGDPVTAADFVRAFEYAARPETLAPQAGLLDVIKGFTAIHSNGAASDSLGVTALDEKKLRIDLEYPAPYVLSLLEYPIAYPRHKGTTNDVLISNGPYRLSDHVLGSSVTAEKNPYYWDAENVAIERVRYTDIPDENALLSRFRTGELHITTTVPNPLMEWITENLADQYHAVPRLAIYYYAFNLERGPLTDRRVRKALNIVVDRQTLVESVIRGGQLPAYSFVPPGMPGYEREPGDGFELSLNERIALAQRLMNEAGYTKNDSLNLTLYYNFGDNHQRIALYVADQWNKHLPVTVKPLNQEFKVLLDTQQDRSKWDVIRTSWTADFPDPYNFLAIFKAGDAMNIAGYIEPEYDRLLASSLMERDPERRMEIMKNAEATLLTEHPGLLLYYYVERNLVSDDVSGYVGNSLGILRTQHLRWAKN